jgi:hypothetical protein
MERLPIEEKEFQTIRVQKLSSLNGVNNTIDRWQWMGSNRELLLL